MGSLDLNLLVDIVREWEAAPHGSKGAVLSRRLPLLGCSPATFHRQRRLLGSGARRKPPAHKGRSKYGNRERQWVEQIMAVKYSPTKGVEPLATWNAKEVALRTGRVPPEARELPVWAINRLAREMGLFPRPRRGSRFEAEGPNVLHQVDATGSRHLFPHRQAGGEWVLKLRPRALPNKEKAEGLRVWCWGLADDFSGFRVMRYCVAPGEAAMDGIEFLRWAWSPEPAHAPFEGLPQSLYMDNGSLAKYLPFRAFCEDTGIRLATHEPYRPQATGKVESGFRELKKEFEGRLMRGGWQAREITLSELNQELAAFLAEVNGRKHRRLPFTRAEAWQLIMHRGGPVRLTPESWEKIFTQNLERTLDEAGCFSLGGIIYQVQELWSCRVKVFQSVTGEALVVEDENGRRFAAEPFVPKLAGEWRGAPKTPLERLLEEKAAAIPAAAPTWRGEADNVVYLSRPGEVRESAFEMPERPAPAERSLEEIAAELEVAEPAAEMPEAEAEPVFASELERYEYWLIRRLKGEEIPEQVAAWMAEMRATSRAVRLLGEDLERRAKLMAG